jgi:hypothetical protein
MLIPRRREVIFMKKNCREEEDALMVEEIQSLHQEKRTALRIIRIGIGVFMAQVAAAGYALRAFRHHDFAQSVYLTDILGVICIFILIITIGLMVGSLIRIRSLDRKILKFKLRHEEMR